MLHSPDLKFIVAVVAGVGVWVCVVSQVPVVWGHLHWERAVESLGAEQGSSNSRSMDWPLGVIGQWRVVFPG